jgi:hypothetical protein
MGAANISKETETVKADIKYASAEPTPTSSPTQSASPSGDPTSTPDDDVCTEEEAAAKECIGKQGPGDTVRYGLVGLAVFQVGLIVAVRAGRSRPRVLRMH